MEFLLAPNLFFPLSIYPPRSRHPRPGRVLRESSPSGAFKPFCYTKIQKRFSRREFFLSILYHGMLASNSPKSVFLFLRYSIYIQGSSGYLAMIDRLFFHLRFELVVLSAGGYVAHCTSMSMSMSIGQCGQDSHVRCQMSGRGKILASFPLTMTMSMMNDWLT